MVLYGRMTERLGNNEFDFNPADYPERVKCKAMPSLNGKSAEVELADVEDEPVVVEVPLAAVILVRMPPLSENIPNVIRQVFEQGAGLGMVSCRIEDRNDDNALISLPAVSGPTTLAVPSNTIVRKVN
jgi:hypothetical protein